MTTPWDHLTYEDLFCSDNEIGSAILFTPDLEDRISPEGMEWDHLTYAELFSDEEEAE